ncbi:MAG: HEAT repeat domain-containing protein, partial [Planctomycetota bacterium]|nr:HEAT repeat domain-containing protein [Planctomycetota bacterium]
ARFQRARTDELRSVLALACGLANAKDVLPALENRLDKSSPKWTRPASGLRRPPGPTLQDGGFLKWGTLALGMLGATSKADKVRAIFKKYHHPAIRESAAISLALLKGRASVRGLVDVLKDAGSMHSKAAVVTALGLLPEPSRDAVDALVDAYKDDSNQDTVRAMAIIALGAMADPRPVALSALLTRDYNYFIRSYALDWIAALL